jgi:hypothetical protein
VSAPLSVRIPPRTVGPALVLAFALAAGCSEFLAAPAPEPAALSVSVQSAAAAGAPGARAAFDRVDVLRVRLSRGQAVFRDDSFPVAGDGTAIRQRVSIRLESDAEDIGVQATLSAQGRDVFTGAQTVRLVRGRGASAAIAVQPAGLALHVSAAAPSFRSLGDTALAAAAVTFATGDTLQDAALAWSTPDTGVLAVSPAGVLVARSEGAARLVVASGALQDQATVTVRAAVASLALTPDTPRLMRADTVRVRATARDARGHPLARTAAWASLDAAVATVAGSGVVTGVAPGQATIRGTADGVAATARVTVIPRRGALLVTAVDPLDSAVYGAVVRIRRGSAATAADSVVASGSTDFAGHAPFPALDEGPYTVFVQWSSDFAEALAPGVVVLADQQVQRRVTVGYPPDPSPVASRPHAGGR